MAELFIPSAFFAALKGFSALFKGFGSRVPMPLWGEVILVSERAQGKFDEVFFISNSKEQLYSVLILFYAFICVEWLYFQAKVPTQSI